VQLFHEAESIAGMFGSAFTNAVFCRAGCKIIPIMPTEFGLDGYLEWIGQVVGFDFHPIIIANDYTYRFAVDLVALKNRLSSENLL
jgi:capsular polysaccharide biosynthesis protein